MTEEKKDNVFGVILHSFFVVPFLLAILSVLLFAAVRLLTMEKHSAFDYLKDIQKGSSDKRWQSSFELFRQMAEKDRWHSAFELSKNLSAKDTAILQERFVQEMTAVYKQSKNDDPRVRLYLIMAMGKSGRKEFVDVLLSDLPTARDEHLNAMINALGMLESIKASVAIQTFLNNDNPRIRLAAVIALGRIKDRMAIPLLRKRLDDSEPNVIWDAPLLWPRWGTKAEGA